MSVIDDFLNTEKQKQNVKLNHMFQKNSVHNMNVNENFSLDEHYSINMSKIAKSYRSYNDDENIELKTNSLVSCAKGLIECNSMDLTKSLYNYLDDLKSLYNIGKNDNRIIEETIIEEPQIPTIIEESKNIDSNIEDEIDFDEIFKASEQELSSVNDQKSLLKNLIDDINVNSKSNYDNSQFERNINEIINETKEEIKKDIPNLIQVDSQIEYDTFSVKKRKLPLILIIIILLSIATYINWDNITEFINQSSYF